MAGGAAEFQVKIPKYKFKTGFLKVHNKEKLYKKKKKKDRTNCIEQYNLINVEQ